MNKLKLSVSRRRGGTVVEARGPLDSSTRLRLHDAIWRAAASGDGPVTVDLSRLTSFDSDSLTSLLGIERVARRQLHCPVDLTGIEDATVALTAAAM